MKYVQGLFLEIKDFFQKIKSMSSYKKLRTVVLIYEALTVIQTKKPADEK